MGDDEMIPKKIQVRVVREVRPKIAIYKEDELIHLSNSQKAAFKYLRQLVPKISLNAIRACLNRNIPTPTHVTIIDDMSGSCTYENQVYKFQRLAGHHGDRHNNRVAGAAS